jgi:hypothetical protein
MAKMSLREYANAWLKNKGTTATAAKKNAGKYKSIAAAKKAGSLYYTDKNGKVQLAVYAEDLKGPKPGGNKRATSPRPKLRPENNNNKRTSSPRPRLRPGSESAGPGMGVMTKAEKAEVDAANKANTATREKMSGKTSAGQKFNAWYKKNGDKYKTMKSAFEAYQKTLK